MDQRTEFTLAPREGDIMSFKCWGRSKSGSEPEPLGKERIALLSEDSVITGAVGMWSRLISETGSPKGCMDLREKTVSGTIGAKTLSKERRRTTPFMSKSLNLEEPIRSKGRIELLDEKIRLWGSRTYVREPWWRHEIRNVEINWRRIR